MPPEINRIITMTLDGTYDLIMALIAASPVMGGTVMITLAFITAFILYRIIDVFGKRKGRK